MRKGVSTVIATILILLITISLVGIAWIYISGMFTSQVATTFFIADTSGNAVTIKNTGTAPITSFSSVRVDGNQVDYSVDTQDSSLVGYWKLDEVSGTTASDSSGNGNIGTLFNNANGTVTWATGKFGNAANFISTGTRAEARITIPFQQSLNISSPVSITAWIYPMSPSTNNAILDRTGGTSRSAIYTVGSQLRATWGAYTGGFGITDGNVPSDTWSFVAFTYDSPGVNQNGTAKLYVNGTSVYSGIQNASTYADALASKPFSIGYSWSGSTGFNGTIDEVKIYNRALTADEVKAEYSGQISIDPGSFGTITISSTLSSGTHTVKVCTSSMCESKYLTIK